MTATQDIVAKLWKLCDLLRDDGVTYSEYVTELTYLLFLKMMEETGEERRIPEPFRWAKLARREGLDQLTHYRQTLTSLGDFRRSRPTARCRRSSPTRRPVCGSPRSSRASPSLLTG